MTKAAKISKGQAKALRDMLDGSDFVGAYTHVTCVALLERGLIENYTNAHGMERNRITEAGRAAIA